MINKSRYKALEILNIISTNDNIYTREYLSMEFDCIKNRFINKPEVYSIVLGVISLKARYDFIISEQFHGDYSKLKSKVKLPIIDEADFPYKFYKCYWKDIQSDSSWSSLNHIK